MTTFKNNSKYAELIFTYLELAEREITPLTYEEILGIFQWRFKGGSLREASEATRLKPETSEDVFPNGLSSELAESWPYGEQCGALRRIVRNRLAGGKMRNRAVMARLGSYMGLMSSYGTGKRPERIFSGMKSVYHIFGALWDWSGERGVGHDMETLKVLTRELVVACAGVSKVDVPSAEEARQRFWEMLVSSRLPRLLAAVLQMKELIRSCSGRQAQSQCRQMGLDSKPFWEWAGTREKLVEQGLPDLGESVRAVRHTLGPRVILAFQGCALWGIGPVRFALARTDLERLHQVLMSAASALVGVCAQAVVGSPIQRQKATLAIGVTERNIQRIVDSSRKAALGDEVLVCKGFRRAYTAHLGWLAGPLCRSETLELQKEAEETADPGVLDVEGFLADCRSVDAASSLNAAKMYKICPAPDVSPGLAMMDRIEQIGNSNVCDPTIMTAFKDELIAQVLRAHIRCGKKRLKLREGATAPSWYSSYLAGNMDQVPSDEIAQYLQWEGSAEMPEISPYDPKHWKDSGLGADTIEESLQPGSLREKSNMITRLIYDEGCPMPGRMTMNPEHVIKFFVKAEGHKDPARGIFSSNLADRQAQSWMERAVEKVALRHPSFMIGQEIDVKEAKILELTARPTSHDWLALYYSFDISGWSAKMPAEPQRISHDVWGSLYGGHLFARAREVNENAHIYLNLDGYMGWFRNTHANLEGYNGKEMTMLLITLLSLSVKTWRVLVVEAGVLTEDMARKTSALLFAYIDDGLCRIDLPKHCAIAAFKIYKETVISTFDRCGFSVEVSKCFPSDRFAIFLNEVYIGGRHVVHGVRAAMGICAEPTERHTSLIERVSTVASGCRGAVMAGLNPLSAVFLMAYHVYMHLLEWVTERDPVVLATWCMVPRSWGGLGLPNIMQLFVSGSGAAFEESIATLQSFARRSVFAKKVFLALCREELAPREPASVLTSPLSGRVRMGYMIDTRIGAMVRAALQDAMAEGKLSTYAKRLLKYADDRGFHEYAECIIPIGHKEVLQEQMVDNVADAHPHCIFSAFARRLEKSMTVKSIVGHDRFGKIITANRSEAKTSVEWIRRRASY